MSLTDFFWIFLILIAFQPMLRQRLLESSRGRLLTKIQQERGSRVILLVHRQETMALLGFPVLRYIDVHDSEQVLRAIHLTDPEVPIDIVLHTPGGLALASFQIARALARHPGRVTAFIPHYAMSGGTLIALAADEIVMAEDAVLGPVDPQIGMWPAASILRAVSRKPVEEIDDETLILADQAEMAIRQLREGLKELLQDRLPPEHGDELPRLLAEGHWTHDFAITCDTARQMGLPVRTGIPERITQLMNLYPQPVRRQAGVEYVPGRRKGRRRGADAEA